ncbi:hypothetical protein [Bradyrhizobium sp. CCBAU 45389]|uniref:hypothetical protein n=1 Tax=Bradyrhizobium sp. CCBAU 45389 TaxID=858429 RepID=UPI002306911A|nr:hypothetical protein [Bradyrhizobium sp. CCBAU 45389]
MWHSLIVLMVMNAVADKLIHASPSWMLMFCVICYAIIFVVAYFSYFVIETPARRYIDSLISRRVRSAFSAPRYSITNDLRIGQAEDDSAQPSNSL